ncbi:membrane protein [Dulcicalothrix desertica PCC 7102]|uniref:Membrane protein n=1 Tax=Dulcicalothrix desertica PCC 7102 TaxID=232991 RepID=A0A433VML7_9CYAN|nr:DUF1345 domain-containing protein [Dulcicalothrix desertica]RUT07317.1 membrane protein [Dulcicalothrix desertica PCC 7102]TWH55484.1 putative membrane protein [Dulcicalothrix desertica PCC 7102]
MTQVLLNVIERPLPRLLLSLIMAGVVFLIMSRATLEFRLLATWDTGIVCFLALLGLMIVGANSQKTKKCAQTQGIDHLAIFILVVSVAFTSLFIIAAVLAKHKDTFTPEVGMSIVAIVCSWLLAHTMFALHYAAFYYRKLPLDPETEYSGGLNFSNEEPPDYLDFMYFTFTLAMTSQTSDTALVTSSIRRLALGHTVMAFFFYSVILALTISIISGLI